MAGNLRLYERGQPSRTPFADEDPFRPPIQPQ
jgi:hypothetical protein